MFMTEIGVFLPFLFTPVRFEALVWGVPLGPKVSSWSKKKTRVPALLVGENRMVLRLLS